MTDSKPRNDSAFRLIVMSLLLTVLGCAQSHRELIQEGLMLKEEGRYGAARTVFLKAFSVAVDSDDSKAVGLSCGNLARLAVLNRRFQEALGWYGWLASVYRDADDQTGEAKTQIQVGLLFLGARLFDQASRSFVEAVDLARSAGDRELEAQAEAGLADVCGRNGKLQEAIGARRRCLDLYQSLGDAKSLATALGNLARTEVDAGILDTAAAHLQRAGTLFQSSENMRGLATVEQVWGKLELQRDRLAEAAAHFSLAARMFGDLGDQVRKTEAALDVVIAFEGMQETERALEGVRSALRVMPLKAGPRLHFDALMIQGRILRVAARGEEALVSARAGGQLATSMRDSSFQFEAGLAQAEAALMIGDQEAAHEGLSLSSRALPFILSLYEISIRLERHGLTDSDTARTAMLQKRNMDQVTPGSAEGVVVREIWQELAFRTLSLEAVIREGGEASSQAEDLRGEIDSLRVRWLACLSGEVR